MSTYERCPDCGRKALRYRKRTKDYSCKQCPFEGTAEDLHARERAAANAREAADEAERLERAREDVLSFVDRYVYGTMPVVPDGGPQGPFEFGCGTGLFTAAISAVGAFFLGGMLTAKLVSSSPLIASFGPVVMLLSMGGTFMALLVITAIVLTYMHEARASAASKAMRARQAIANARWQEAYPDYSRFLAMKLSSYDLSDPEKWRIVKGLALTALAASSGDSVLERHSRIRESLGMVERHVMYTGLEALVRKADGVLPADDSERGAE